MVPDKEVSMQNFREIGPVVFAGEYLGMKIGCSSYSTSKPVSQPCHLCSDDHFEGSAGSGFELKHPSVGRVTEYVVDSDHRLHDFPLAANWAAENDPNSEPRKKV